MTLKRAWHLFLACFFVGMALFYFNKAFAAETQDCEGLTFATGTNGKGYSAVYANIEKMCGSEVKLCELQTHGGLDNLNALSTKDADVGLAMVSTWTTLKNDENIGSLQAVAGMNYNYLHIIVSSAGYTPAVVAPTGAMDRMKAKLGMGEVQQAARAINNFSDLKGLPVALSGSAQELGRIMLKQGAGFVPVDAKDDNAGIDMLKKGQVAAVFSVSGWPMPYLKDKDQSSGLTLAAFDGNAGTFVVKALKYPKLGVYNMNMLGIQNVLLSRPFKGEKAADVSKLKACLSRNLSKLQEGKFEPAWNEIKSLGNIPADITEFHSSSATVVSKKK